MSHGSCNGGGGSTACRLRVTLYRFYSRAAFYGAVIKEGEGRFTATFGCCCTLFLITRRMALRRGRDRPCMYGEPTATYVYVNICMSNPRVMKKKTENKYQNFI